MSAGTFTLGHVGPKALTELLRVAAPGALFVLSINKTHYVRAAFAPAFAALFPQIDRLSLPEVPIYGPAATGPHADDRAFLATFRKR